MTLATVIFLVSLCGIVALFAVKYWEERQGLEIVASLRKKADQRALKIKDLLNESGAHAAKLPPKAMHLVRYLIHIAALEAAHMARLLEEQAHRLADFVSHKHHFEKGETRSEFLKRVSEHKNGLNAERVSEQEKASKDKLDNAL